MPKINIHPTWSGLTPIICDGKVICLTGSVKPDLNVDVWLANHPFYLDSHVIVDSEGRVEKFMKKYGLNSLNESK